MACNDINSSCTDSCDQIDGLFEAASNLVQYRDIIERWLNGKQNETVQIGGEVVKTLLGLIADIKQLVGVFPDGRTIILDDKRKVLSVLLASGGGIKVKSKGGLYVDVNEILVLGGGLAMDEDGKIYVDFSQMPTDKFESLLKSIRVPIWLTANKNFYVNGTTGSDTLDEGRGESEEKPFKTIQAAIEYVASNYNINKYTANVLISDGTYEEDLNLPKYSSTTGVIVIKNKTTDRESVVVNGCVAGLLSTGKWDIQYLTIKNRAEQPSLLSSNYYGIISQSGSTIILRNCKVDISNAAPRGKIKIPIYANGGLIEIRSLDDSSGLAIIDGGGETTSRAIFGDSGGKVLMISDIDINVEVSVSVVCLVGVSVFSVTSISGMHPKFTGNSVGKRYDIRENSIASTNGNGPEFIPGSINGTTSSGGQYT